MSFAQGSWTWKVLGVILVLIGLYALIFDGGRDGVIYLGGGSAVLLLLARKRLARSQDSEASQ